MLVVRYRSKCLLGGEKHVNTVYQKLPKISSSQFLWANNPSKAKPIQPRWFNGSPAPEWHMKSVSHIPVAPGRGQMPFSLPQKQPELLSPVSGEPQWLTLLVHSITGVPCNTWICSTWINHEIKGYLVGDSVVSLHKPTQASQI